MHSYHSSISRVDRGDDLVVSVPFIGGFPIITEFYLSD